MKLSTKCRYGMRALLDIARNAGDAPVKRKDIAQRQEVSDYYLEAILITMKNAGIIDTVRGARGGYVLARGPSQITTLEVLTALEGPLELVDCTGDPNLCNRSEGCVTRDLWKELVDAWERILGKTTLQDLLDRQIKAGDHHYDI